MPPWPICIEAVRCGVLVALTVSLITFFDELPSVIRPSRSPQGARIEDIEKHPQVLRLDRPIMVQYL